LQPYGPSWIVKGIALPITFYISQYHFHFIFYSSSFSFFFCLSLFLVYCFIFQLVNQFIIIKYRGKLHVSTSGIIVVSLIVLVVLAVVGLKYNSGASHYNS
jgi:hypothetical protein